MSNVDTTKQLGELEVQVAELTKAKDVAEARAAALVAAVEKTGSTVEESAKGDLVVKAAVAPEYIDLDGEKIEKSAVPPAVLAAIEKANARVAVLEKAQEAADISKRVEAVMPNVVGSDAAKAAIMKAVDALADDVREDALTILKGMETSASRQVIELGSTPHDDDSTATFKLDQLAKAHAVEKSVPYATAYAAVSETGEGLALFKAARVEQRSAN